jgi:hypothetical protein
MVHTKPMNANIEVNAGVTMSVVQGSNINLSKRGDA